MPTHHSAFEEIYRLKSIARAEDLYVAECDIRGFYDSVDHGVAFESLHRVDHHLQATMPGRQLHPRAVDMVRAYLDCYSFPHNVLGEPQDQLKREDPLGYFPWRRVRFAGIIQTQERPGSACPKEVRFLP